MWPPWMVQNVVSWVRPMRPMQLFGARRVCTVADARAACGFLGPVRFQESSVVIATLVCHDATRVPWLVVANAVSGCSMHVPVFHAWAPEVDTHARQALEHLAALHAPPPGCNKKCCLACGSSDCCGAPPPPPPEPACSQPGPVSKPAAWNLLQERAVGASTARPAARVLHSRPPAPSLQRHLASCRFGLNTVATPDAPPTPPTPHNKNPPTPTLTRAHANGCCCCSTGRRSGSCCCSKVGGAAGGEAEGRRGGGGSGHEAGPADTAPGVPGIITPPLDHPPPWCMPVNSWCMGSCMHQVACMLRAAPHAAVCRPPLGLPWQEPACLL